MFPPPQQNVLVTGATDGIGRAFAARVAQLGATVLVHGRDPAKLDDTVQEIRRRTGSDVVPLCADLSSLGEVDRLAVDVARHVDALHLVVSNAAVGWGAPDAPRELSADGYELRFAVNHLASHHLVRRLVPLLEAGSPSRVVQVVSEKQEALDLDDVESTRDWSGETAYARSKLAQTMSAFDLAADLDGRGVAVHALHPASAMDTTMVREAGIAPRTTLEDGLTATVRLSLDPTLEQVTGGFYDGSTEDIDQVHPQALDAGARARLRERTAAMIADAPTRCGTDDTVAA